MNVFQQWLGIIFFASTFTLFCMEKSKVVEDLPGTVETIKGNKPKDLWAKAIYTLKILMDEPFGIMQKLLRKLKIYYQWEVLINIDTYYIPLITLI